jgi:hypothetical protein
MSRRWDWSPRPARRQPWPWLGVGVALVVLWRRPALGGVALGLALAGVAAHRVWPDAAAAWVNRATRAVGAIISTVALTIVFALVVVPLALLHGSVLDTRFPGPPESRWRPRPPRAPDARQRWS